MTASPDLRIRIRVVLAIAMLGWAGCTTMSAPPAWVSGEQPPEYPKNKFVTALGTGATFEAAQIAAKSELSRVFSASLRSEVALIEKESVVGKHSEQTSDLLVDTRISTDVELQGAEAPLHWRDSRTGEIWALAVLERRKECLRIQSEGQDLITHLDRLVADSRNQSNPLVAVRASVQATKVSVALDGLQARSRVLGTQCLGARSTSTGELKAQVDSTLRGLSFVVKTEDVDPSTGQSTGPLPQLREVIAGNLTKMGFQVGPASGARMIPIDARLRLQRVERGTDWIEYRWEGSAEIGSPIAGEPAIIAADSEGAESHPDASTARLRARRKGEMDLARQLDTLLKAFLVEDS